MSVPTLTLLSLLTRALPDGTSNVNSTGGDRGLSDFSLILLWFKADTISLASG